MVVWACVWKGANWHEKRQRDQCRHLPSPDYCQSRTVNCLATEDSSVSSRREPPDSVSKTNATDLDGGPVGQGHENFEAAARIKDLLGGLRGLGQLLHQGPHHEHAHAAAKAGRARAQPHKRRAEQHCLAPRRGRQQPAQRGGRRLKRAREGRPVAHVRRRQVAAAALPRRAGRRPFRREYVRQHAC